MDKPRVKTVNKQFYEKYELETYPNAGPNPSVKGMREQYYGNGAYLLRYNNFIYKVPKEIYEEA